jgi:GGDEF domain-containing protein
MGEGEFALLLPARSAQGLDEKILQLHDFAREAGQVLADEAMLSVAVGTAAYPVDGQEAERLLAMADERMSLEKAATKLSLPGRPARRLVASPLT